MNYLLKSKPRHTKRPQIIIIISLYLFLSLFGFLFSDISRRFIWSIAKPIWSTSTVVSSPFVNLKNYLATKTSLANRNTLLEEENSALKIKELEYDMLLTENQNLKYELGRKNNIVKVLAGVLSKPPRSPYDTLVIDAGSSDNIIPGSKVYVGENILIGLITNITPNTSLVNMFSTGGQKQESILSRTGTSFVLVGNGGQNFKLEVPKDTDLIWGDVFVYPGLSQSVLAVVYYIDSDSQSSFKTAYLRIPVNVFATKFVFVE